VVTVPAGAFANNKLKVFIQSGASGIMVSHQTSAAVEAFQVGERLRATSPTNSGGGASSSCSVTCPTGTKIASGVCANNTALPQFMQGLISGPGTNTTWSCLVKNQNSASGSIAAQGTAICLPQ
jgi:hypothetical protein